MGKRHNRDERTLPTKFVGKFRVEICMEGERRTFIIVTPNGVRGRDVCDVDRIVTLKDGEPSKVWVGDKFVALPIVPA